MELKIVDVKKDILKGIYGLGIDSSTAKFYLDNYILSTSKKTLFVLDFRKVVFDNYFAETYGALFQKIKNHEEIFDAIFQMKEYQIDVFLLGLVDYLKIEYSKDFNGSIKDYFLQIKSYVKLMNGDNKINFLYNLSEEALNVLNFVNEKLETSFDDLYNQKIVSSGPELANILDNLKNIRFIYSFENDKYISVYKYLNQKL